MMTEKKIKRDMMVQLMKFHTNIGIAKKTYEGFVFRMKWKEV
jgi:hypothetical protein